MDNSYLRAIRGPVLLMTLGGLLAMHRFLDWSFWRMWPVLLIVLGVLKLAEVAAGRTADTVQPGGPS